MSDEDLRALIRLVLAENPMIVDNIRNGKSGQGFLIGRTIMRMPPTGLKEPSHVLSMLQEELDRV